MTPENERLMREHYADNSVETGDHSQTADGVRHLFARIDRLTAALAAREASEHDRMTAAVEEVRADAEYECTKAMRAPTRVDAAHLREAIQRLDLSAIVRRHLAETDEARAVRKARAAVVEAACMATSVRDLIVPCDVLRAAEAALAKRGR